MQLQTASVVFILAGQENCNTLWIIKISFGMLEQAVIWGNGNSCANKLLCSCRFFFFCSVISLLRKQQCRHCCLCGMDSRTGEAFVCDKLSFRSITGIIESFLLLLRLHTLCELHFSWILSKWKTLTERALIG